MNHELRFEPFWKFLKEALRPCDPSFGQKVQKHLCLVPAIGPGGGEERMSFKLKSRFLAKDRHGQDSTSGYAEETHS